MTSSCHTQWTSRQCRPERRDDSRGGACTTQLPRARRYTTTNGCRDEQDRTHSSNEFSLRHYDGLPLCLPCALHLTRSAIRLLHAVQRPVVRTHEAPARGRLPSPLVDQRLVGRPPFRRQVSGLAWVVTGLAYRETWGARVGPVRVARLCAAVVCDGCRRDYCASVPLPPRDGLSKYQLHRMLLHVFHRPSARSWVRAERGVDCAPEGHVIEIWV